ncbi:MAG: Fe-S cluster assembly ATPase SufC [Clostridia bacterium]|nr:Fe-S cluster assembly ATPase SufC [Clostridia bacterium]
MKKLLEIKNLFAKVEDKEILKGLNLNINKGEIHVIMGPNGAGKSTLANVILSNPSYTKTDGKIIFDGKDITNSKTDEIARDGIFMSFQSPEEVSGISVFNFIKMAKQKRQTGIISYSALKAEIDENMKQLNMKSDMSSRNLNVGFSGGEKKKNEILQMLELSPKLAILDETDSGLDVDAIKTVSKGINLFKNKDNAILIITHGTKILENLNVDYVHVLVDGKIVFTGKGELAAEIEKQGYAKFKGGK